MKTENANRDDARDLAYLVNLAGEGIPEYLWSEMAEGSETALDVGTKRASRDEGGFSYRNARVVRIDGEVSGLMVSYQLDCPYVIEDIEALPEVVRPLVLLEAEAPGSWYVNAIATKQEYRGRGVAKLLMQEAESIARKQNINSMSLIVASENTAARKLYEKLGYVTVASLPVVEFPGCCHGGNWELMVKSLKNIHIRAATEMDRKDIRDIYLDTFPESESDIVSKLAIDLLGEKARPDTVSLLAETGDSLAGHVAFSPVTIENKNQLQGYILAPLAVGSAYQKQGVASKLIKHGMEILSEAGVDVVFVYGDPAFYKRFGFNPGDAESFIPQFKLQYPFGWQAVFLKPRPDTNTSTGIVCVDSLNNPDLW